MTASAAEPAAAGAADPEDASGKDVLPSPGWDRSTEPESVSSAASDEGEEADEEEAGDGARESYAHAGDEEEYGEEQASDAEDDGSFGSLVVSDSEDDLEEDSVEDDEAPSDDADLQDYDEQIDQEKRDAHIERFRMTLEDIFSRYNREFEEDGDEIDLHTLEIVEDRGFLRSMGRAPIGDAALALMSRERRAAQSSPRTPRRISAHAADEADPDDIFQDSVTPDEEYRIARRRWRFSGLKRPASPSMEDEVIEPAPEDIVPDGADAAIAGLAASPPKRAAHDLGDASSPATPTGRAVVTVPPQSPCDAPGGCSRGFCLTCLGSFGR